MDKKEISEKIKNGLKKKGMKQKDLALMMGNTTNVVTKWVNGKALPPGEKLIQLINILDIQDEVFPKKKDVAYPETVAERQEKETIDKLKKVESVEEKLEAVEEAVKKIAKAIKLNIKIEKNNKVYFNGATFGESSGENTINGE